MPGVDPPLGAPYIPVNDPTVREEMLDVIGADDIMELYGDIPEDSQFTETLDLPEGASEYEVRSHVESLLSKNADPDEFVSFLGGGTWPHYVPALCDEIINRSEFLTAYVGDTYSDYGRHQAFFEAHSMLGELLEVDAVGLSMYDWATAAGDAARMTAQVTGRDEVIVPEYIHPDRLSVIENYFASLGEVTQVAFDPETGQLDLEDLQDKISSRTAGVYFENPTFVGTIETEPEAISDIAHDNGALSAVGVDPISLGILEGPGKYGADIVVGEGQPLGVHQNFGGGAMGIMACRDDEDILSAMPAQLVTIAPTEDGEGHGFSFWALPDRSMYHERASTQNIVGSSTALWTIAAGVYLALLGPELSDLGKTITTKSRYAKDRLDDLDGVEAPLFEAPHFKEFLVNFDGSGVDVATVNEELLEYGIQGGRDVSDELPEFGESALYCVTEVHERDAIDDLASSLEEVTG